MTKRLKQNKFQTCAAIKNSSSSISLSQCTRNYGFGRKLKIDFPVAAIAFHEFTFHTKFTFVDSGLKTVNSTSLSSYNLPAFHAGRMSINFSSGYIGYFLGQYLRIDGIQSDWKSKNLNLINDNSNGKNPEFILGPVIFNIFAMRA